LLCDVVAAEERLELNTVLMESTFKLQGEGSRGTAFIIGRPSKKEPEKAYYVLVTAAHVLDSIRGDTAQVALRKKKKDGTWEKVPYTIKIRHNDKPLWIRHDEVDVAAMYIGLPKNVDIPLLPIDFLVDDKNLEQFEIHPGDELMCLGYPLGAEGPAGFSVLRSGKIASYPLLPTKQIKTFLYSFEIFEGNSGGPVYFVESGRTYKGSMHVVTIQFIAGLISKQYFATETIVSLREKKELKHALSLAVVVHASLIKETIEKLPEID
jgi:hypothetical protein